MPSWSTYLPRQAKVLDSIELHNHASEENVACNAEEDFSAQYDFCIVFPTEKGEYTDRGIGYVETLKKLGFETFAYIADEKIFLLVRISLENMRQFADKVGLRMLLDESMIEKHLKMGDSECGIAPVTIAHMREVSRYTPYKYIYGRYCTNRPESVYWRDSNSINDHPFRDLVKLKICSMLLEKRHNGNENLKIRRYLANGWLLGCFVLHNQKQMKELDDHWNQFPCRPLPLDEFKEYFGEKIGLLYSFLEFYTYSLIIPGCIGIPLQIAVFVTNDYSAPFLPIFSVVLTLWAVTMLEVGNLLYLLIMITRKIVIMRL